MLEVKQSSLFSDRLADNLSYLVLNKNSLNIKSSTLSGIWKAFLMNDGSMTSFLANLTNNQIQFKVVSSERVLKANLEQELKLIETIEGNETKEELIKRVIYFFNSSGILMEGISYWDPEIYKEIFGEDICAPIGKVMQSQKVEFFRTITEVFIDKNEGRAIRFSNYRVKGKNAFLLIEVFHTKPLEIILGLMYA